MGRLRICDFVGMYYALRLRDPNRQSFDVGYSLVKCAVSLCVTNGLIEQVREVVKQCVLVLNVECQDAVKEPRHVVEILFPYFFAAVAVTNK